MGKGVDLPGVAWNTSSCESIMREGYWLELIIRTYMEGVGWLAGGSIDTVSNTIAI